MAKKLPEINPLEYLPYRYDDYTPVSFHSFNPKSDKPVLISGSVQRVEEMTTERGRMLIVWIAIDGGRVCIKYFRYSAYHLTYFKYNSKSVYLFGVPKKEGDFWCVYHPEFIERDDVGKIIPVYKTNKGISQKRMRDHIWETANGLMPFLEDEVSCETLKRRGLPTITSALSQIHNPISRPTLEPFKRLAYREMIEVKKRLLKFPKADAPIIKADMEGFARMLSFKMTGGQVNAVGDVMNDMALGKAMRRILVGDVGCGKTVVAKAAAYICLKNSYRTLVMSPTTVLAEQTCEKFKNIFGEENVSLYTGDEKENPAMIIVGTHAILNKKFAGVGLVILDETQKFGVVQRNKLLGNVHALQMTATPIPRTISLLYHGCIELSEIKDMPFPRDVVTRVVSKEDKSKVLGHLRQIVSSGGKALVIYPLVSLDKGDYTAVESKKDIWEKLYPGKVAWVHGKLEDKVDVVSEFRKSSDKQILVATCLIETGLDCPEASIMVISGAEKFGIAQLHQLRGRIGRRGQRSYCYFMFKKPEAEAKLKPLESISDGFILAEMDSDMRGWGDALGEAQSGHCFNLPSIRIYKDVAPMVDEDLQTILRRRI